jgi:hypothetical protein
MTASPLLLPLCVLHNVRRVCDHGGDRVWDDPTQQCACHSERVLTECTAGVMRQLQ